MCIAYFTIYLATPAGYIRVKYRIFSGQRTGKDGEETSGLILVISLEGRRETTKNFIKDGRSRSQDFKHSW